MIDKRMSSCGCYKRLKQGLSPMKGEKSIEYRMKSNYKELNCGFHELNNYYGLNSIPSKFIY